MGDFEIWVHFELWVTLNYGYHRIMGDFEYGWLWIMGGFELWATLNYVWYWIMGEFLIMGDCEFWVTLNIGDFELWATWIMAELLNYGWIFELWVNCWSMGEPLN